MIAEEMWQIEEFNKHANKVFLIDDEIMKSMWTDMKMAWR